MYQKLRGRDFLSFIDITREDLAALLDLAVELKRMQQNGAPHEYLKGKTLGMVFAKASTRTRISFEVGMYQLGGRALFLSKDDLQIGRGEPACDTARVLSRYLDGIMVRTFSHKKLQEFADFAAVPVINGLTDEFHPCQVLADLLTIRERFGDFKGRKLAYIGDGNNMANSLLLGGTKAGLSVTVAAPKKYAPDPAIVKMAEESAAEFGAKVTIIEDIEDAVKGADILYTDVWTSMGDEDEREQRNIDLKDYKIDRPLVKLANPGAIVMHCLPAHRGEEISAEVMDDFDDVIFGQAENRLHAQKAIMALIMGN